MSVVDGQHRLAALIATVQLKDVRLIEAVAKTRIRSVKVLTKPQLIASHAMKVIARPEDGFLVSGWMRAHVVSHGEDPSEDSPVYFNIGFALEYELADAKKFSDETLTEFARVNAAFNAWPYWREFIQTTVARMNLPPLVLPVLRIQRPGAKGIATKSEPKLIAATEPPRESSDKKKRKKKR